jgi:hypothetical protein
MSYATPIHVTRERRHEQPCGEAYGIAGPEVKTRQKPRRRPYG